MAGKGGARPGAGRKPGSKNKTTAEIARKALEGGVTPLDVMLKAMRAADAQEDMESATKYANMAAPYCHPRLAAIDQNSNIKTEVTVIDEFGYKNDAA